MFSGDVQCVYCKSKINFSGNVISYQSQICANHNQEHQFPGMQVTIQNINKINTNIKPFLTNLHVSSSQRRSAFNSFKYPTLSKSRKQTTAPSTNKFEHNKLKGNIRFASNVMDTSPTQTATIQNCATGKLNFLM